MMEVMTESSDGVPVSDTDRRFVEQQIRAHVDLAQWKPDPYALTAPVEAWRRAFAIAELRREGIAETADLARHLGASEQEIESDARLVPYLDRTIAGLLSVLGWHFQSGV
jgi:hypothetical protein